MDARYPHFSFLCETICDRALSFSWQKTQDEIDRAADVIYVYGLNPHAQQWLQWLEEKEERTLVFFEDKIERISQWRQEYQDRLFTHPRIHLYYRMPGKEIPDFIKEFVDLFPVGNIQVIDADMQDKDFAKYKEWILRKSVSRISVHKEMLLYEKVFHNVLQNASHVQNSFDLSLGKDALKDIPAIVCGAGPSLEKVQHSLKSMQHKACILVGGSAISALGSMGIEPHLSFAIDPNPEEFTRLCLQSNITSPLVFGMRVEPRIFYSHAGPLGYFSTGSGGFLENYLEQELGIAKNNILDGLTDEAISVTSIVLMSAIYLGCNPIVFAGVDLAYQTKKRYAPGVIDKISLKKEEAEKSQSEVSDTFLKIAGKKTDIKWLMEKKVIEQVIKNHPEKEFFQGSSGGLNYGAKPLPDWQVLNTETSVKNQIQDLLQKSKRDIPTEKLQKVLQNLAESFQRCIDLIQVLIDHKEDYRKTFIAEMDLEEEIAFQYAIKPILAGCFLDKSLQKLPKVVIYEKIQKRLPVFKSWCTL